MNIVNLTPHAITLLTKDEQITIKSSGKIARVAVEEKELGFITDGIPLVSREFTQVENLPPLNELAGKIYLVSSLVLESLPMEYVDHVFAPDTGATAIRENGQIVAVTRLIAKSK